MSLDSKLPGSVSPLAGRSGDPLYAARRTLHTGHDLLTEKQKDRLEALFVADNHAEVEATWGIYQRVIAAYRDPDGTRGKQLMQALIGAISTGVPAALTEVITLGRTLKRRTGDVLAYFDRPGTSNGPTEALQCRHRHWSAYAEVWDMPTKLMSGLFGACCFVVLSA